MKVNSKKILVLIDRDGTLIYDDKYHLGRTNDWKKKVKILPYVVEGLKLLKKQKNIHAYIITNQPGIAIKEFKLLTEERSNQVCKYVQDLLNETGGGLEGFFVCPHALPSYAKKRKEYTFDNKFVCKCSCIKPKLGMVFDALKKEGITKNNAEIFVIGDIISDIQTAQNIKGTGILVPFFNEPANLARIKSDKNLIVAKTFLEAAEKIIDKIN